MIFCSYNAHFESAIARNSAVLSMVFHLAVKLFCSDFALAMLVFCLAGKLEHLKIFEKFSDIFFPMIEV